MMIDVEATLTREQAARELGTTTKWLGDLVRRGALPKPFKVPHRTREPRLRFFASDIRRYVAHRDAYSITNHDQNEAA
jgi:hypothetical protein